MSLPFTLQCPYCKQYKMQLVETDPHYVIDCVGCKKTIHILTKDSPKECDLTNPSHYSRWQIEPLDFISANNLDFLRGNIIKYIMRYDAKGGIEDLKKARVYLDRLIAKTEKEAKND